MMNEIIKVQGLSKKYCKDLKTSLKYGVSDLYRSFIGLRSSNELRNKEFWALQDINFTLEKGQCLGLIGHNGAGKSTLLKIINGLIQPSKGNIEIFGKVGALIELGAGFNPILTGRENIFINGTILGLSVRDIKEQLQKIIDFSEIGEFIDTPVQNYSSGMKVRLGFAIASQLRPELLIIDEVLAVGDVRFRMKCYDTILKLKEEGSSIILVSHNMIDIGRVCDEAYLLSKGKELVHSKNVPFVISEYEKLSTIDDSSVNLHNTKPVYVETVETFDKLYHPCSDFSTGDEVYVKVKIINNIEVLNSCRLIIHIETPNLGHLGSFSSPYKNKYYEIQPGENEIWFMIEDIPLLKGGYFIDVALNGKELTQHYDWNRQQCHFRINYPEIDTFGYGLAHNVYFKHQWL